VLIRAEASKYAAKRAAAGSDGRGGGPFAMFPSVSRLSTLSSTYLPQDVPDSGDHLEVTVSGKIASFSLSITYDEVRCDETLLIASMFPIYCKGSMNICILRKTR
jgi:hypothetical protein